MRRRETVRRSGVGNGTCHRVVESLCDCLALAERCCNIPGDDDGEVDTVIDISIADLTVQGTSLDVLIECGTDTAWIGSTLIHAINDRNRCACLTLSDSDIEDDTQMIDIARSGQRPS